MSSTATTTASPPTADRPARFLVFTLPAEEPVIVPAALARRCRVAVMTSSDDPTPRIFELRVAGTSVALVEVEASEEPLEHNDQCPGADCPACCAEFDQRASRRRH